jgi:CRP/FNR family transcriptional regulator, anaerobic regulatory protein
MNNPFENILPKDIQKLLKDLEAITFNINKNEDILTKINNDNMLAIILDGTIQITKIDYYGNKTIVDELYSNNFFNTKLYLVTDTEYQAVAKINSKILLLDYDNILSDISNTNRYHNQFIKNLFIIQNDIINEKNERIEILTKRSIRNKLLELFKIFSIKNNSNSFTLPFTFTDLADYLSVDRSAMQREIKLLKDEGFIEIKNKRITLLYK